jgi:DnaD/phage-associated family protein
MSKKRTFSGFHQGRGRTTSLPDSFFNELLPSIDHLGELKVTLYAFWAIGEEQSKPSYLRREDFQSDTLLMQALGAASYKAEDMLQESLERAVIRGSLLKTELEFGGVIEELYFLNTPNSHAALQQLEQGEWAPSGDPREPVELRTSRPNIYNLYEQNIGALTPMLAEELREAEQAYPNDWIEEAIRIAVGNNVRKWRYVAAILEDWKASGKDERETRGDSEKARRRYVQGKFSEYESD